MGNDYMSMSFTEMDDKSTLFATNSETLQGMITELENAVNFLCSGSWQGNASAAFASQFDDIKPGLVSAERLMSDISQQLHKISEIMQQTQNDITSVLQGL